MVTPLLAILIGFLLGLLAGFGVGGGTLLILWLTVVNHMDAHTARGINLLFFIAATAGVSVLRFRKGKLNLKQILPAMISGCIAAALCACISRYIDHTLMRKLFGILLLITGTRELFYRPRKAR